MPTTYELYTNENGTPKAVEGKAPAIVERVENLETSVENFETSVENLETSVENLETSVENLETSVENLETSVETAQATADACLPLSGGTIMGNVVLNGKLRKSTLGGELQLVGGTDFEDGACIALYGGDCTSGYGSGQFLIRACSSGASYVDLVGNHNGSLTWGGKNVLCSTEQNIQTNGYVKFSSGLMIQWGVYDMADGSAAYTYTFPTPFPNNCFSVAVSSSSVSDANFQLTDLWRTGFAGWYGNTKIARWIAIGN